MTATKSKEQKSFEQFKLEREAKQIKAAEWAKTNGWAITGLKTSALASEETTFFRATVTKDGKKVGEAENDGRGGSTFVNVRGIDLTNEEAELLEIFVDDTVETQAEMKWVETQAKNAQKKGASFLLAFKKGSRMEVFVTDAATLTEAKAEAAKKKLTWEPYKVYDFSATAAVARQQNEAIRLAKWKAKATADFAKAGAKVVVFWKLEDGRLTCRGFRTTEQAEAHAKTVKNPETLSI